MKEISTVNRIKPNTWEKSVDNIFNGHGTQQFIAHLNDESWMVIEEYSLDPNSYGIEKVGRYISKFSFDEIDYDTANKATIASHYLGGIDGIMEGEKELWNQLVVGAISEQGVVDYEMSFVDTFSKLDDIKQEFPLA